MATYNPYTDVNSIYNYKKKWQDAANAGNTAEADKAKQAAQRHYQSLIDNGLAETAEKLNQSNYNQAKAVNDYYGMLGKSSMNDYLGSKISSAYGLPVEDVTSQIKINPATNEVSFYGKNVGTPYSVVDGVSYLDTGDLDNILNDFAESSGLANINAQRTAAENTYNSGQNNLYNDFIGRTGQLNNTFDNDYSTANSMVTDALQKTYDTIAGNNSAANEKTSSRTQELRDMITGDKTDLTGRYDRLENFNYENPFTSEAGQSILNRYDLQALQGRDNAAAEGAGDNYGNIDSYSAANALRQQAALRSLGEQSALAARDGTVSNGRGILRDMANYNNGIYDTVGNTITAEADAYNTNNQALIDLLTKGFITNRNDIVSNNEYMLNGATDRYNSVSGNLYDRYQGGSDREYDRTQGALNNEAARAQTYSNITRNELNNEADRAVTYGDLTGVADVNIIGRQMGVFDGAGNIINPNQDFNAKISAIDAYINSGTVTSRDRLADLATQRAVYVAARDKKIQMPEYSQFADDTVGINGYSAALPPTYANTQNRRNTETINRQTDAGLVGQLDTNAADYASTRDTNAANTAMNDSTNTTNLEGTKYTTDSNERLGMRGYDSAETIQQTVNENNIAIANIDKLATESANNTALRQTYAQIKGSLQESNNELAYKYAALRQDDRQFNASLNSENSTNGSSQTTDSDTDEGTQYTATGQSAEDYLKTLSPGGKRYEDSIKNKEFKSNLEFLQDIIDKSKLYDINMNDALGIAQARGISTDYLNGYYYEKGQGITQQ